MPSDTFPNEEDEFLSRPDVWAGSPAAKNRRWPIWAARSCILLLILVAGVTGYAWWQARSIVGEFQAGAKRQVVEEAAPELNIAPSKPTLGLGESTNILIIGSDNRKGETSAGRSDTMMLMRIDPENHRVSILSIPRDLRVPIPGHGVDKINASYTYGGPGLLIKTVREYFGVPVDHFFQVDFDGFGSLVSELGGVYVPVDGRYLHVNDGTAANNWSPIDVHAGYQKLGRADALAFVRFRHLDSDFTRAARQQLFMREVGREVRQRLSNPVAINSMLHTIAKATTSDVDSLGTSIRIANTLRSVPPESIRRVTLQADDVMISSIFYLQSTETQKNKALRSWAWKQDAPKPNQSTGTGQRENRPKAPSTPKYAPLIPDNGRGLALTRPLSGLPRCAPTKLPVGYSYGATEPARRYKLNGEPAVAMWATKGSGKSVLWMWTTWQNPPILAEPTSATNVNGKRVEIWKDSGKVRQVSWKIGRTRAWITNTLGNDLTQAQMLSLVSSCRTL